MRITRVRSLVGEALVACQVSGSWHKIQSEKAEAREGLVVYQASMEEAGTNLFWWLGCQASALACLSSLICSHEAGTKSSLSAMACQASTKLANSM